jgi:hypothetical protein
MMATPEGKVTRLNPRRPDIHVAGYGEPGSRKSTTFSTFPQPIVVAHFDAVGKDMPYWKLGKIGDLQRDKRGIEFREVVSKGNLAARIEYYQDPLVDRPQAASTFLERLNRLPKEIDKGECRTFCFETVTSSALKARKMYQYDLEPDRKDPRKWYGGAVDVLEEVLLIQLPGMQCNVCVGLHVSKERIEAEGTVLRAPFLPGRLMESFASQWPEIWRFYIERDRKNPQDKQGWIQTASDERWSATSMIEAPDPCEQDYAAVWKNWDKANRRRDE